MSNIPISFIGNNNLYEIIKNNYSERKLSNSIIIYGEKGIGKSTFVRFLAIQIFNNFKDLTQKISDFNHISLINSNAHPNFILIEKKIDEKSKKLRNFILIDQIRDLESFIYKTSVYSHLPKIILIDDSDQLNINAANALLKILEEPKQNTYFFLISHQLSNLIPTIRSRCIKFKLEKPSFEHFSQIINYNNQDIIKNDINILYDFSNGSPGLALEYYTEDIHNIINSIVTIFKENKCLSSEILDLSVKVGSLNNDQYKSFLSIIKFILSNLIKIFSGVNIQNQYISEIKKTFEDLKNYINLNKCITTMNYIDKHQNDLFIFNLDKKIFTLNLFSELSKN